MRNKNFTSKDAGGQHHLSTYHTNSVDTHSSKQESSEESMRYDTYTLTKQTKKSVIMSSKEGPEKELQLIKYNKRLQKNREYARDSRENKKNELSSLKEENERLSQTVYDLKKENGELKREHAFDVDENLPSKRKREDSWLSEIQLSEPRTYVVIEKLKAQVAQETMQNFYLERELQKAVQSKEQSDKYISQLVAQNKSLEEANRKLNNTVSKFEKENHYFNDKVEYSLSVYDNYPNNNVFTVEHITEVNPEYRKNYNTNMTLFKPEQKGKNISSPSIFDIYLT